jgi:lipoprotein-anchoring transpeptidase ErfK/SrfK
MKRCIAVAVLALCWAGCNRAPSTPPVPAGPVTNTAAVAATAVPTKSPDDGTLERARALKDEGKLAEARAALQTLGDNLAASDKALDLLGEIDTLILFSPAPAPEKVDYTIIAGDSLGKLAKQFGTTMELIKKSNNMTRDVIRLGDRLRIYQPHFAVTVSKSANALTLTDNGKFFKRYKVGTGQFSKTPVGDFKITSRIANPEWHRPDGKMIAYGDPENILGTHWLGLDVPGYGLHGTWDTNSIGKAATAGCIRLLNNDIAELYTILPVGTPVTIRD